LRKAAIIFVICLSARSPARMQRLGCHWTDFREIRYLSAVREIKVSLQYDKNDDYFT